MEINTVYEKRVTQGRVSKSSEGEGIYFFTCALFRRHYVKTRKSKKCHLGCFLVARHPIKRGRHKLAAEDVASIKDHILSCNPIITYSQCKHAPNRLYPPPKLSISAMHQDYNSRAENKKVGYSRHTK